jgi:Tfp pilus assembly protein PilN
MLKATRVFKVALFCGIFMMGLYFSGCTKHPNQEQLSALEEQKKAALAAEEQLDKLRREKADLENQLAKKKAELEKSKKEKEAVQQRLEGRQ